MSLPKLDCLPADIVTSTRAVVWKFETRDGRLTKPPYQSCRPHEKAAVDNPSTWSTFTVAYDTVADGKADGAGIVLVGDGLIGIDLDGCVAADTSTINPDALAIIQQIDSYTEITPSGQGLRIFARGALPPGRRVRRGAGHTGVELYETRKFLTVTGRHVEGTPRTIETRTSELAALHQQIFGVERPPVVAAASIQPSSLTDAELLIKASRSKNSARFDALWNGDLTAYGGDRSAADLALANLLAFWSGRNPDQIDRLFRQSRLFRAKWDSKRGTSTYGAWTIAKAIEGCTTAYTPGIDIELEDDDDSVDRVSVISTREGRADSAASTDESEPVTDGWPRLHPDAYTGLFGDLIQALEPHTEADPVGLLGHALIFFGNLVGRTPQLHIGRDVHRVNENLLCVGETGVGRKGVALSEAKAVMALIDPEWAQARIKDGLSSGEGLIYNVRDPGEDDDGIDDKRLLIVETEFAKTLRVSRREGNTLSTVIRQCWDSGDLRVLTRTNPLAATGVHVSIVGHITPQELRKELKTVDMGNGLLNRFVLLLVRRSKLLPFGGQVDADVREALIRRFTAAAAFGRALGPLQWDQEAHAHWDQVYAQLTRARAGLLGAISNRAPSHILRLASIYALADQSPVIRLAHQRAAVAVWQLAEATITKIFGRRVGQRLPDYLLAELRTYPDGLTRTQIRDLLMRNGKAEDIHEALQELADYGLARAVKEPASKSGGRPVERWFAHDITT